MTEKLLTWMVHLKTKNKQTKKSLSRYKDNHNVNTQPGFGSRITINNNDGSLVITTVAKEDMGWYVCRPSNGVGQDPEAAAYLNITCKW